MIRMALTKGRIEEKARNAHRLRIRSFFPFSGNRGRKLLFRAENAREIVLASPPTLLHMSAGVCDCRIVGEDTIMESDGRFYELLDLNSAAAACSQVPGKYQSFISGYGHKVIASKYPAVTKITLKDEDLTLRL